MKAYERIVNSFSKFFNSEELDKILGRKIDFEKMLCVSQTKASRTELQEVVELIDKLYGRTKTLSIWCVEMARSMLP
jgi:Ca2+-binding EF-hand superfamily protein